MISAACAANRIEAVSASRTGTSWGFDAATRESPERKEAPAYLGRPRLTPDPAAVARVQPAPAARWGRAELLAAMVAPALKAIAR